MSFATSEEELMLEEAAIGFLTEDYGLPAFRKLRDNQETFSAEMWQGISEMGWPGIIIEEKFGGSNMSTLAACTIVNIVGQSLSSIPFISSAVIAPKAIQETATEKQMSAWLIPLSQGDTRTAISVNTSTLTLSDASSGYSLSGTSTHLVDGNSAEYVLTTALKNGEEFLCRLSLSGDGIERTPLTSIDGRDIATVKFDKVQITTDDLVGKGPLRENQKQRLFAFGSLVYSAELVGMARAAFEMTLAYLKERKQFGQVIGSFQALQHRMSLLFIDLSQAEALVAKTANMFDESDPQFLRFASLSKAKAGKTALAIANESIQMHGGIGMTEEYDIGLYLKRVAVSEQIFGDYNYHADKAARLAGY
ncbi:acyl-CoA dehydrogenase family protein [Litorimonas sp.]|uniref:acyl-CoA dehydrogenase family protein n=1 Tax=Litorimonas sp. TaxID=1892381 RepID=UPI003A83EE8E